MKNSYAFVQRIMTSFWFWILVFGSSSTCSFLLGFAFSSHVDKSSEQGLVRLLGNQILTCDFEKIKWMRRQVPYEMKQKIKTME